MGIFTTVGMVVLLALCFVAGVRSALKVTAVKGALKKLNEFLVTGISARSASRT